MGGAACFPTLLSTRLSPASSPFPPMLRSPLPNPPCFHPPPHVRSGEHGVGSPAAAAQWPAPEGSAATAGYPRYPAPLAPAPAAGPRQVLRQALAAARAAGAAAPVAGAAGRSLPAGTPAAAAQTEPPWGLAAAAAAPAAGAAAWVASWGPLAPPRQAPVRAVQPARLPALWPVLLPVPLLCHWPGRPRPPLLVASPAEGAGARARAQSCALSEQCPHSRQTAAQMGGRAALSPLC